MLAMGTTLTVADFVAVGKRPGLVALGAALQYTIMPALGFGISHALRLPTPYAVGLCLVACCPGGVASNVVTFLACADVPLSVCVLADLLWGACGVDVSVTCDVKVLPLALPA